MADLSLALILHQSYVDRWHIAPMHREQTVADHAYRVTIIAVELAHVLGWTMDDLITITHMALLHDADEVMTGDVPGPSKSDQWPVLDDFHALVKVADAIETGTWWVMWGNPGAWSGHPYNQAPGRDIAKIVHYSKQIDALDAAADIWRSITGKGMAHARLDD